MTILVVTDKNDILDIVTHPDHYIHEGDGLFRSVIGHDFKFQVPIEYVVRPETPTQPKRGRPKKGQVKVVRTPITHREHIITTEGETLVVLPGGVMPLDEWKRETHTVRERKETRPRRERVVPEHKSRYSLGESLRHRPVIKQGRRTIEWGFGSKHEAQIRLDMLQEAELAELYG